MLSAKRLSLLAEFFGRRGEAGEEDVHEIGAAAEHSAGRIHPDLHHLAAADQIVDRARLDERQPDPLAVGRRGERHPAGERRIVLHVVELGEAARRRGKARIGRHIPHPLAVDEQLAAVAQRLQQLLAGTNAHAVSFASVPRVQFGVMPEDAVLVEGDPAVRGEIGGNAGPRRDPVVHRDNPRIFRLEPRHRAREGIAQTRHDLEQRQIGIGEARRRPDADRRPCCAPAPARNSRDISAPAISENRRCGPALPGAGLRSRGCWRSDDGCRESRRRNRRSSAAADEPTAGPPRPPAPGRDGRRDRAGCWRSGR